MICRIATINETGTLYNLWRETDANGRDWFEVVGAHLDPPRLCICRDIRSALAVGLKYPKPKVLFLCNIKNSC